MPDCLHVAEDQRRFQAALADARLTVLGREGHGRHLARRPRLVLTSRVETFEVQVEGGVPVAYWNPVAMAAAAAFARAAPEGGTLAIAGGARVMTALLSVTDRFDLAVAHECRIPGGRPCLEGADDLAGVEAAILGAGLRRTGTEWLAPGVELRVFERADGA